MYRQRLSLREQIANVPEFIFKEYKNRELPSPLKANGKEFKTLFDVRDILRGTLKVNSNSDLAEYKKIIYNEISRALQNIGLVTLVGAIPIRLVLPDIAAVIAEDWNYCRDFVEKELREDKIILKKKKELTDKQIHFSRRHGEWLACAAVIYLHRRRWRGAKVDIIFKPFGKIEDIEKREQELRENEPDLSKKTSKEIRKFLYDY